MIQTDNGQFIDPDGVLPAHQDACKWLSGKANARKLIRAVYGQRARELQVECETPVVGQNLAVHGFVEVIYQFRDAEKRDRKVLLEVKSNLSNRETLLRQLKLFRLVVPDVTDVLLVSLNSESREDKFFIREGIRLLSFPWVLEWSEARNEDLEYLAEGNDDSVELWPPCGTYNAIMKDPTVHDSSAEVDFYITWKERYNKEVVRLQARLQLIFNWDAPVFWQLMGFLGYKVTADDWDLFQRVSEDMRLTSKVKVVVAHSIDTGMHISSVIRGEDSLMVSEGNVMVETSCLEILDRDQIL